MKRILTISLIVLVALCSFAQAAKVIPNGSSSQSITVAIRDAAGALVTGITIANLDLYCVRDGDQMSAKTDLAALASDHAAWSSGGAYEIGQGLYRIDIPDANLLNGVGTMLTYVVDDAVGTNVTSFYEVQLTGPWQTADLTAQGYTSELATNLGTANSNVTNILADTSAMDTASELRTLLTGSNTAVSTLTAADVTGSIDLAGILDVAIPGIGITIEELFQDLYDPIR